MINAYYELFYTYKDTIGDHYFQIGYFSSEKKVLETIEILKFKPGFRNFPKGFDYQKLDVATNSDFNRNNNVILYELSYEKSNDDGTDSFMIFDVFHSYESALEQKNKLLQAREFCEFAEGFCISEKKVDNIEWREGFKIE